MSYCFDTNIFIESWNRIYPKEVFPTLWEKLIEKQQEIIIIKPIYDELFPTKSKDELVLWLTGNNFSPTAIDNNDEEFALNLRKKYKLVEASKGADTTDSKLISFAKNKDHTVVTYERVQPNKPGKLKNYKIPLICEENKVKCIPFIDFLKEVEIEI